MSFNTTLDIDQNVVGQIPVRLDEKIEDVLLGIQQSNQLQGFDAYIAPLYMGKIPLDTKDLKMTFDQFLDSRNVKTKNDKKGDFKIVLMSNPDPKSIGSYLLTLSQNVTVYLDQTPINKIQISISKQTIQEVLITLFQQINFWSCDVAFQTQMGFIPVEFINLQMKFSDFFAQKQYPAEKGFNIFLVKNNNFQNIGNFLQQNSQVFNVPVPAQFPQIKYEHKGIQIEILNQDQQVKYTNLKHEISFNIQKKNATLNVFYLLKLYWGQFKVQPCDTTTIEQQFENPQSQVTIGVFRDCSGLLIFWDKTYSLYSIMMFKIQ